jgi:membrane associated rhomboid family serine protease
MIPLRDDNPTTTRPIVAFTLIGICILVFLWQVTLPPAAMEAAMVGLGLVPAVLFGQAELADPFIPPVLTVFTSMFLHGGLMHLGGNMLYLWIFGDNVEDSMGHGRFIAFYLLCGIAAALTQSLPDIGSTVPMIGASGAISGVLGAYLVLFPRTNVLVAIPLFVVLHTVRMPAVFVLGLWFVGQLLSSMAAPSGEGGVAFRAHIGGFVAGLLLVRFFVDRRPRVERRWP